MEFSSRFHLYFTENDSFVIVKMSMIFQERDLVACPLKDTVVSCDLVFLLEDTVASWNLMFLLKDTVGLVAFLLKDNVVLYDQRYCSFV